jgi:hypothetical protein
LAEACKPGESSRTLTRRDALQQRPHALGFQDRTCALDALSGLRQSQLGASSIDFTAGTRDIARRFEPIDGNRHGRRGNPHVAGELAKCRWLDGVQVIEDARLVRAQEPLRLWVAYVPSMTSEVDPRVRGEQGLNVATEIGHAATLIEIVCFVKSN